MLRLSIALRLNQYNPMELGIEVDASEDPRIQGGGSSWD